MSVEMGLAIWLVLSFPFAIIVGAVLTGDHLPARLLGPELVGLDGNDLIVVGTDGSLERVPLRVSA
jgi:hypothetical protein